MKNSTVLAAALAAGLMTFAANAQEGSKEVSKVPAGTIGIWTGDMRTEKEEKVAKQETAPEESGKTSEEAFQAAKAGIEEPKQKDDAVTVAEPQDRYKVIIERYAFLNGIPVDLAHAVITVESNYKPYSLGKAGEVGLMQIKPATAKMMGYDGTTKGLFDPETNIKFGMKYLGKAQRLGGGTTCGTILKYNAGHAAKRMNAVSRDYCKKVKRHLASL